MGASVICWYSECYVFGACAFLKGFCRRNIVASHVVLGIFAV